MRSFISPYNPSQTAPSINRLHTIIDIDKGRIPDNPRLQGGRTPEDTYATNPFYFGASNVRRYRSVKGGRLSHLKKAMRLGAQPSAKGRGSCPRTCGCNGGGIFA